MERILKVSIEKISPLLSIISLLLLLSFYVECLGGGEGNDTPSQEL